MPEPGDRGNPADVLAVVRSSVEYAGNVLLDEHDAAIIIRFESTGHDRFRL